MEKNLRRVLIAIAVLIVVSIACGSTEDPTPTEAPPTSVPVEPTSVPATVAPAPTATPRPTTPPQPTTAPRPQVIYSDSFEDESSGWDVIEYENGNVGYRDGSYFAETWESGGMVWGLAGQNFSDAAIEVDITQVLAAANNNNGFGVMCRVQADNSGYLLRISGDGFYAIHRINAGAFEEIVGWTSSPAINQGNATNHLRAVCDGSTLAVFVNGQFLGEATDTTFASGDIGLAATTFEDAETEIRFDNLVVAGGAGGGAAPPPSQPPVGILFGDDFSNPSSGWEIGQYEEGNVGYESGYYFVESVQDGIMVWATAFQNFSDILFDVDIAQIYGPANDNNGYGVLCRVQPGDYGDGYAFLISGDGYYTIQKIVGGDYEPLVAWNTSSVINQGNAENHIRAVCDGTRLELWVNGQLLAETTDATYASGDISLVAGTLEAEPTEIHFDNVVIATP
ncbi:MAG: hypothetical protein JXD18_14055 [Anaerolineae bacterium]|nr:hypothetical protein [Anaerolineae bacterium]